MANKIKHNKLRNVGIVFEALNAAVTDAILDNRVNDSAQLFKVISKWFGHGTYLGRIYREYYEPVINGQVRNSYFAYKLLKYLRENYDVNEDALNSDINGLLEDIDYIGNRKAIFDRKIPNFKLLASYKTLLDESEDVQLDPQQRIVCEQHVISHFLENKDVQRISEAEEMLRVETDEEQRVDNELYNVMYLQKFNEHYGPQLTEEQKTLINKFLMSESDKSFRRYAEKKLASIINEIDKKVDLIEEEDVRSKLILAKQKLQKVDVSESLDSDDISDIMAGLEIKEGLKLY